MTYALFKGHSELGRGSKHRLAHRSASDIGEEVGLVVLGLLVGFDVIGALVSSLIGACVAVRVTIGDLLVGLAEGWAVGEVLVG